MNRILAPALVAAVLACDRSVAPVSTPPDAAAATPPAEVADAAVSAVPPPASPATSATPAASAADGGTPSPAVPVAAAPAPEPTRVTAAVARVGTQEAPLQRGGVTTIDPVAAFELTVPVHLADGRLALHDEADAMVASTGTTELGESTSRYRVVPDEPLRPGSRYVLRLDGAVTREPHGLDGRAYAPVVLQLQTSGERPAAASRKKRGPRR